MITDSPDSSAPSFNEADVSFMRRALQLAGHARDAENEIGRAHV